MIEPMSEEHSFLAIPDEFVNWKGDTAATPNTLVRRVTETVSYAQELHIELDRLRSRLATVDAVCEYNSKHTATATTMRGKLLCLIGIHDWWWFGGQFWNPYVRCRRCRKRYGMTMTQYEYNRKEKRDAS